MLYCVQYQKYNKVIGDFTTLIPRIISKDVELLFTVFGREVNGTKKLNFSNTETYKIYLLGFYNFTLFF